MEKHVPEYLTENEIEDNRLRNVFKEKESLKEQIFDESSQKNCKPKISSRFQRLKGFVKESFLMTFQVLVIFLVIINFVGRVSIVQGSSMIPSLHTNNRVLINLFVYRFTPPHRGDIIVFKCPVSPDKDYIKRVIALPGEIVEIKDGCVYVNDNRIKEPYVRFIDKCENICKKKVPKKSVFVLGDNRINSEDSRSWGAVSYKLIKGKANLIFWPPDSFNVIK